MEFKFRAIDEQASMYTPPSSSSSISYFTEQALRAGYGGVDQRRITETEFFPNPRNVRGAIQRDFGNVDHGRISETEFFRKPSNFRDTIQRELEKERIREEIIASEIARRRILEEEVRREMLIEREMMALQRVEGFPFSSGGGSSSSSAMTIFEPRLSILNQSSEVGRSLEERLALSLQERLGHSARREIGGFQSLPFQRNEEPKKAKISEVKPLPEVSKERIIFLAKPDGNVSGAKRKAATPPGPDVSELSSVGMKKKSKEEWSCALCQVMATSERGLNEHLQGKKHKSKEAGLRAHRTGKNYSIGLFPKKTATLVEITENPSSEQEEKVEGVLIKNNEESLQKNQDSGDLDYKNNKRKTKEQMLKMWEDKKRRFKFWCETCHVGANFERVMNKHKKGKKHMGRLQGYNNDGGFGPAPKNKSAEVDEMEKEAEVVDKDEYAGASEDVDGAADADADTDTVVDEEQQAAIEVAASETS